MTSTPATIGYHGKDQHHHCPSHQSSIIKSINNIRHSVDIATSVPPPAYSYYKTLTSTNKPSTSQSSTKSLKQSSSSSRTAAQLDPELPSYETLIEESTTKPNTNSQSSAKYFLNPHLSTCYIAIQELESNIISDPIPIHSFVLAPASGFFRDLLDPDFDPDLIGTKMESTDGSPCYYQFNDSRSIKNKTRSLPPITVKKWQFWEHVNNYATSIESNNMPTSKPILLITLPTQQSQYLLPLLAWLYKLPDVNPTLLLPSTTTTPISSTPLLHLAKHLNLTSKFYQTAATKWIKSQGPVSSTLLDLSFHYCQIPIEFLSTYLATCGWVRESDKLSLILFWGRDEWCSCCSHRTGSDWGNDVLFEVAALVRLYVDFGFGVSVDETVRLRGLFPKELDALVKVVDSV
ncbi:hypothetical protein HDU76_004629 [Blyttiomyces sp. JEL0837]|nr:hypothetical protein HDU76_004629 [Blyttiomyces sp. JEL0837]